MYTQGMSADEAITWIAQRRTVVSPNPGFREALKMIRAIPYAPPAPPPAATMTKYDVHRQLIVLTEASPSIPSRTRERHRQLLLTDPSHIFDYFCRSHTISERTDCYVAFFYKLYEDDLREEQKKEAQEAIRQTKKANKAKKL